MDNVVYITIFGGIIGVLYALFIIKNPIKKIKLEKLNMNKLRFVTNYYFIIPSLIFSVFGAVISAILMDINNVKYLHILIIYLIIIAILVIGMLTVSPIIRKHEIKIESSKIDFNLNNVEDKNEYKFTSNKGFDVVFSNRGIYIDKKLYGFDRFYVSLQTSNQYLLVNLRLCFDAKDENSDEMINSFFIPLTKESLYAMKKYNILIQHQDDLDYIISNKENAAKQILTYGMIKNNIK